MPRKLLIRTNRLPYHVTARTNNCENFHLDLPRLWDLIGSECYSLSLIFSVEFHSLVLMPNHFHILLTVPALDLGQIMNRFMSNLTRASNRRSGRSGHIFGGPYYWSVVSSTKYYRHAFKYVYRNPVKANLCDFVQDYPFSTAHGLIGRSRLPFPIYFTRVGMEVGFPTDDPFEMLDWLNIPFPVEAEQLIQQGLRKKIFENLKCRISRKPYQALELLL